MTTSESTPEKIDGRPARTWLVSAAGGLVVGLAIGSGVTAALGSKSGDKPPAVTAAAAPGATSAVDATPMPAPTTPSPSSTSSPIRHLGEEVDDRTGAKMIVFAFKQPVAQSAPRPPQDGSEWAAADVQICATTDISISRSTWHLVYADHTTIDPSSTGYSQFPEPNYPWGETNLPNGRCIRGWITYPAPVDKRPVSVEHHPDGGVLDEWTVL